MIGDDPLNFKVTAYRERPSALVLDIESLTKWSEVALCFRLPDDLFGGPIDVCPPGKTGKALTAFGLDGIGPWCEEAFVPDVTTPQHLDDDAHAPLSHFFEKANEGLVDFCLGDFELDRYIVKLYDSYGRVRVIPAFEQIAGSRGREWIVAFPLKTYRFLREDEIGEIQRSVRTGLARVQERLDLFVADQTSKGQAGSAPEARDAANEFFDSVRLQLQEIYSSPSTLAMLAYVTRQLDQLDEKVNQGGASSHARLDPQAEGHAYGRVLLAQQSTPRQGAPLERQRNPSTDTVIGEILEGLGSLVTKLQKLNEAPVTSLTVRTTPGGAVFLFWPQAHRISLSSIMPLQAEATIGSLYLGLYFIQFGGEDRDSDMLEVNLVEDLTPILECDVTSLQRAKRTDSIADVACRRLANPEE